MRRYWQPAAAVVGIAGARRAAGARAPSRRGPGRVPRQRREIGLVDAFCPHRRAPLFFGRNEECGLRCVYHGWKFDVTAAASTCHRSRRTRPFKTKVHDHRLSDGRARRHRLGLYGAEDSSPRARFRMDARARYASPCLEDLRGLQLAAGARRRARYRARLVPAQQRSQQQEAVTAARRSAEDRGQSDRLRLFATSSTRKPIPTSITSASINTSCRRSKCART